MRWPAKYGADYALWITSKAGSASQHVRHAAEFDPNKYPRWSSCMAGQPANGAIIGASGGGIIAGRAGTWWCWTNYRLDGFGENSRRPFRRSVHHARERESGSRGRGDQEIPVHRRFTAGRRRASYGGHLASGSSTTRYKYLVAHAGSMNLSITMGFERFVYGVKERGSPPGTGQDGPTESIRMARISRLILVTVGGDSACR